MEGAYKWVLATHEQRYLKPAERLLDALVDPSRRSHALLCVLFGFLGVWTLYGVLSLGEVDVNPDVPVLWSREWSLEHHPPMHILPRDRTTTLRQVTDCGLSNAQESGTISDNYKHSPWPPLDSEVAPHQFDSPSARPRERTKRR
jgi:hypothetical protein